MKKIYTISIVLFIFVTFVPEALSQIKIFDNGYVGINYTTSTPLSRLVMSTPGSSAYQAMFYTPSISYSGGTLICQTLAGSGTGTHIYSIVGQAEIGTGNCNYGVYGRARSTTVYTTGKSYGVYGIAGNATSGYNYGVYGYLYGSNNGAAVFGTTTGDYAVTTGKYAGFFYGNVKVTSEMWANVVTESDERIKSNIVSIHPDQSVANIKALNPVTYNLKQREINNAKTINANDSTSVVKYYDANCQFFQKPKYGLLAQEVQKVYPDLVYEDQEGTLGIDYTGLIPVLISAIQEQQRKIDELESEIKSIRSQSSGNTDGSK